MKTGLSLLLTGLAGRAGNLFFATTRPADKRHAYKAPTPWQLGRERSYDEPDSYPRACFKLADRIYQTMTNEERAVWAAAVKKRGISGYDLFMSEALTLANRHENYPDSPSVSGGFGTRHVIAGSIPPPDPTPPCARYDCIGGVCVLTGPEGAFPSLAACLASGCEEPPPEDRWDCIGALCLQTDPEGEFETYAACIASGCEAPPPIPCNTCSPALPATLYACQANTIPALALTWRFACWWASADDQTILDYHPVGAYDYPPWSPDRTYAYYDHVHLSGLRYYSIQPDNTNHPPPDTDWWQEDGDVYPEDCHWRLSLDSAASWAGFPYSSPCEILGAISQPGDRTILDHAPPVLEAGKWYCRRSQMYANHNCSTPLYAPYYECLEAASPVDSWPWDGSCIMPTEDWSIRCTVVSGPFDSEAECQANCPPG